MTWDKPQIVRELRRLHKSKADISYNGLSRSKQALVSAAAYHFKSYRKAVEAADIDYAQVTRRPRWTRKQIVDAIKRSRAAGEPLHWGAVVQRRDEMGKAAFASLQPRLFGSWRAAVEAAGLTADDVSRYRRWSSSAIIAELKQRQKKNMGINSGALQANDPGLHAAAVREFGGFDRALRAAGIDPQRVRQRRAWTESAVIKAIRKAAREGKTVSDSQIRRTFPALYGAAVRLFGSFTKARAAAKVKFTAAGPDLKGSSGV